MRSGLRVAHLRTQAGGRILKILRKAELLRGESRL